MSKIHVYGIALLLALAGTSLFVYKVLFLQFPLAPHNTTTTWTLETSITFTARNEPVKVELFIPKNTPRLLVMDESFISRGFGLTSEYEEPNKKAVWSIRKAAGTHTLYYRTVLRKLASKKKTVSAKSASVESVPFEGPLLLAAKALIEEAKAKSADTPSFVAELLVHLNKEKTEEHVSLLLGKKRTILKRAQVAVQLLGHAAIPARVVHGVHIGTGSRDVPIDHWIEVFDANSWIPFHADNGTPLVDDNYVPWWRGDLPLNLITGASRPQIRISLSENQEDAITSALAESQATLPSLFRISLFNLPLQSQAVFKILLLVPVGALIMVILRNIIGITTFGTFMPILIALAFRETGLWWGLSLFITVVGIGLLVRFYLENLKLLLVPRLATVLTVVIILMVSLSFFAHSYDLGGGLSIALFPMVILTMTIERMTIVWEERGALQSLKQGLGSLMVASLTYLIIDLESLSYLVFVFPELLLLVLACIIILGRYTGYRLLELTRFRALSEGA